MSAQNDKFFTRSAEEAKAIELLDIDNLDAKGIDWTPERQLLAMVFRAMWSNSLPVTQINRIAAAMGVYSEIDLQDMCTRFARARILRSRRGPKGVKLYEVNF